MVDRTYKEAFADNALVWQNPVANQELITGGEVFGATSGTDLDSGILFSELQKWILETYGSGVMFAADYDTNGNGIVNAAESVSDGGSNVKTAVEISGHIDDATIHAVLNDFFISSTTVWSSIKITNELASKADQSSLNAHTSSTSNPHSTTHAQLSDGGANAHSVIDAHLAIIAGNPHGVQHSDLADGGLNSHAQIDSHISSTGNPHSVSHAQVAPGAFYSHSQLDAHVNSTANPHGVTAAQVNAAPDTHPGDTSHLTINERAAMDNVTQALNAGNPFATLADIPPGSGHVIQDEGVALTQRPNLNFIGPTVTVTDNAGNSATDVTITASGNVTGPGSSVNLNLAAFDGVTGDLLLDSGYNIPPGGAIAQVLGKASAADHDMAWIDQTGGGGLPEAPNDSYGYTRLGGTTNAWARGSRVFEQATAPTSPSIGDIWIDTT